MKLLRPAVLVLLLAVGCSSGGDPAAPSSAPTPTAGTPAAAAPGPASLAASPAAKPLVPRGYVALWPFRDQAGVSAWQSGYRTGGHSPWRLDAEQTALSFTQGYLGLASVDRVTSRSVKGAEARIGVGYRGEEGDATAAVLHLFRVGTGPDAPWEVVGTDDTTFTLTAPGYGAKVTSPVKVGGRVTGVDENIQIRIVHPAGSAPLGEHCCLPAGGTKSPWSASVTFTPAPGVLTIAAWTGGHVNEVERFAVTGVESP